MEEHPFTILEADDFQFRIQLMESETTKADAVVTDTAEATVETAITATATAITATVTAISEA